MAALAVFHKILFLQVSPDGVLSNRPCPWSILVSVYPLLMMSETAYKLFMKLGVSKVGEVLRG